VDGQFWRHPHGHGYVHGSSVQPRCPRRCILPPPLFYRRLRWRVMERRHRHSPRPLQSCNWLGWFLQLHPRQVCLCLCVKNTLFGFHRLLNLEFFCKYKPFSFSPKDPLRCNSPVAMETSMETMDPLGVNAPMQPEGELCVNTDCHYWRWDFCTSIW